MSDQSLVPGGPVEMLRRFMRRERQNLNVVKVGKVIQVNTDNTVDIEIQGKIRFRGAEKSYPQLKNIPYMILGGGGAYIDMPVTAGDEGLVFFCDYDISLWQDHGGSEAVSTDRTHSLSDAFFVGGVHNGSNVLSKDGNKVIIHSKNGGMPAAAARVGDEVTIELTVLNSGDVAGFTTAAGPVTITAPVTLKGTITKGSEGVDIG